jgi:acetyl-CoA C-acetyltransferase
MNRPVAIVGGLRLPFCKMGTSYLEFSALDLMSEVLSRVSDQYDLGRDPLGEVAVGTVFQSPAVWNFAREAVLRSKLHPTTPALTLSRACATSLDAAWVVAQKIASGHIESGIAGGSESMSGVSLFLPPSLGKKFLRSRQAKSWGERLKVWSGLSPKELRILTPPPIEPSTGLLMGEHAEQMAKEWAITREAQDALALASHQNGVAAYERGFYKDLVSPFAGVTQDGNLRSDTSLERLARLKPSFDRSSQGTLTAGNSSPLTDGASAVLLASETWAKERGLKVLAYLRDVESAAIDLKSEGLLMAPAYAVPRLLKRNKLTLQQFDFYEIHEAFAAQVLCTLKAWESEAFCKNKAHVPSALGAMDRAKLNVAGGSVALGHPFGATGTRVLATLSKLLEEKGSGRGLLSICTGGGMGTTAIVER